MNDYGCANGKRFWISSGLKKPYAVVDRETDRRVCEYAFIENARTACDRWNSAIEYDGTVIRSLMEMVERAEQSLARRP